MCASLAPDDDHETRKSRAPMGASCPTGQEQQEPRPTRLRTAVQGPRGPSNQAATTLTPGAGEERHKRRSHEVVELIEVEEEVPTICFSRALPRESHLVELRDEQTPKQVCVLFTDRSL